MDHADELKSLHTALIDSCNGYDEALKDADGKGLTLFFSKMIALRRENAAALEKHLRAAGEEPDRDGSFMSTVHRTVIGVRSLFGDLDERILPGLIDGEERIKSYYDEAVKTAPAGSSEQQLLRKQLEELADIIAEMKTMNVAAKEAQV